MNDASEVLGVIFDCLHWSFTSTFGVSDTESIESNGMGSWDCANQSCVVHSLFGMNVLERLNCSNCRLESREMKYTSFFYNINASALRSMKVPHFLPRLFVFIVEWRKPTYASLCELGMITFLTMH